MHASAYSNGVKECFTFNQLEKITLKSVYFNFCNA